MGWETDERLTRLALQIATDPLQLIAVDDLVRYEGAVATAEALGAMDDAIGHRLRTAEPEKVLVEGQSHGMRYIIPGDDEWPVSLRALTGGARVMDIGGHPLGLWVRGPRRLNDLVGSVAIIGSRSATTYGDQIARNMAYTLAEKHRVVVSGLAFGIDQAAHRGAIAADPSLTVAVVACGADRCYPVAHQALTERIAHEGAVVSEYPPGTTPTRAKFLARNRLVAALTGGTVLVEGAIRSGSMVTVQWARRLGRPVMAVPGPITSVPSEGCHSLIQQGQARLVTSGAEVDEFMTTYGAN